MASKFSNSAAALALGMAFIVTPALLDTTSPFAIDSAFAKKGGNGNGNGGGNGNGNGGNMVAKAEKATKVNHGAIASKLGALNAAHASANALAKAKPNSRVGKIAAYRDANAASVVAAAAATEAATNAATAQGLADAGRYLQRVIL